MSEDISRRAFGKATLGGLAGLVAGCASSEKPEEFVFDGNYVNAVHTLNRIIKANPSNIEAYRNRGYAHSRLANTDSAINDYSVVLSKVQDAETYLLRGLEYVSKGMEPRDLFHVNDGIADFKKSIELDGKTPDPYAALAHAYLFSRKYDEAVDYAIRTKKLLSEGAKFDHVRPDFFDGVYNFLRPRIEAVRRRQM